jgi:hypothetical protein
VNDEKKVEVANHQIMRCIMCYAETINVFNPRTKERKGLITYYKTYGITISKKNVNVDHSIIAKEIKGKINNVIIESVERQPTKKRSNITTHFGFCN